MDSSPQSIKPTGTFEGLKPGAILFGAIVDNVATVLVNIPLALAYLPEGGLSQNDEEALEAAFEALASNTGFLLWALGLGLGCTVLGAYVGATRAGQLHIRHGGWISVTAAVIGLAFLILTGDGPPPETPVWYEVASWGLLVPAGLLGGELSRRLHASHSE
jgi:hypothetical protein